MTGNECVTLGALAAGCRFAAAYPISPATEIFEALCAHLPKNGGTALQTEDEIAALCAAIGAGFAGARSMTSTSGPGLSLMAEAIGLSGCAEVPVVIIDVQRAGPSTGLPTKTEQSDFYHALFCSHGEIPRIVIAAGDASQCFDFTVKAFNLAEVFQCPVILMSEQSVGQNKTVMPKLDFSNILVDRGKLLSDKELAKAEQKFLRYKFTEDGISPRAIPSQVGGVHIASGNEHLESGRITEDPEIRVKIMDKRQMKLAAAAVSKHLPKPLYFGDDDSKTGIITVGHNTSMTLEALDILKLSGGGNFAMMQLTALMPFPSEEVMKFAEKREKIFVIENNKTAQISSIIKMHVPIHDKLHSILKYNGIAFSPREIAAKLSEVK
jgi:2-oxoglutarate ferredoxin oxidoreductase subunit alpha